MQHFAAQFVCVSYRVISKRHDFFGQHVEWVIMFKNCGNSMISLICCWLLSGFEKSSLKRVTRQVADEAVSIRGVQNSGFRLFCRIRIRIALPAEHFDAAPAVLIFTTSLCTLLITVMPACCLAMTLFPSFVFHNQAVWARAAGTDSVKSAVDVSSRALCVRLRIHYSDHYSEVKRIRSEYSVHPEFQ